MKHRYRSGELTYEVSVERHGDAYRATINGDVYDLEVLDTQPGAVTLRFTGHSGPLRSRVLYWAAEGETRWISTGGCTFRLDRPRPRPARTTGGAAPEDTLRAPMPGQVAAVQVREGDAVEAGQVLLLLEAMKMEIRVQAPRPGRVAHVLARLGDTVQRDQALVELEAATEQHK
jgi:acetyl/propionyl-CoA carboxylase alpha subunit